MTEVVVLGGGVGGLSAAHELAERGFEVSLYEASERFGGKARSLPGPESSDGTRLPAEHGFRHFPGFYQHVIDTMSRIPINGGSVTDNLVETTEVLQANTDRLWLMSTAGPTTVNEYRTRVHKLFGGPDVPKDEKAFYLFRLGELLTCCKGRLNNELDEISWWEYIGAEQMSPKYKKTVGYGVTKSLQAVDPKRASTRSMGIMFLQLMQGFFGESMEMDSVLNGPTNQAWIHPWTAYLESLSVDLQSNTAITAIESDGSCVTGVRVDDGGAERTVTADYYIIGLPIGVLESLLTSDLETAAPSIGGVVELEEAWMNGIQFYLKEDVKFAHGHSIYYDSPWALTSISQRQFWQEFEASNDKSVGGILSVIIANWDEPGVVYGKPARESTRSELKTEVIAQLETHLNGESGIPFSEDLIHDWFLDPAISFDDNGVVSGNSEPLFVNTVGSLRNRPDPATNAENLMIATDYARTNSEFASMESANEAARRAVNAVIDRSGWTADSCEIWEWTPPAAMERFQQLDRILYRAGLPHPGAALPKVWKGYSTIRSIFRPSSF